MTTVHDKFTEALRSGLDTQLADLGEGCFLAAARAADVPEETITAAVAQALDLQYEQSLAAYPVSHEFVSKTPIAFARRHGVVALAGDDGPMPVAISDLAQRPQVQMLARILDREVRIILAPREEILRTINAAYQQQSSQAQRVIEQLDSSDVMAELQQASANEDLLDVATRAPVIKLVNLMLFEAVKRRASDVHVQPYEDKLIVRFRVDGVLHDVFEPPKALQDEILSRIKVMGQMNIAERRLSQDGRATVEVGDRIVDLRIATLPTCFGERAVIRLLDKSIRLYELGEIGMPDNVLNVFRSLIHMDHGIVLVTGPTGSGKSTTLYAALQEIDAREMNVVTLEDPIEYRLDGISQTQVSEKKGMTFASGLRSVLRQDPDIIMVGEIRDSETAQMAIQSALTGHLVFSTLHTNDAAGAVARMLDLGVEPYLLASSLLGVMAQRLVRQICPECKSEHQPSEHDLRLWGLGAQEAADRTFFKGIGCPNCLETGYRERKGIFELLTVDDEIREMIIRRGTASSLKAAAAKSGMTTLRTDAAAKAARGVTTMDEVARVTGRDEF
jgi:general secretion pathway protein E